MDTQHKQIDVGYWISVAISFFHPDYTVGTGVTPVRAVWLVDFVNTHSQLAECGVGVTTDRELAKASPCPEGLYSIVAPIIAQMTCKFNVIQHTFQSAWEPIHKKSRE